MFALINLAELSLIRYVSEGTKCRAGYAVVPVVQQNAPAYDSNTEKLVSTRQILSDRIEDSYNVVPLTEVELAAKLNQLKDEQYTASENAGYTIPGTNIVLSLSRSSREAFSQYATMLLLSAENNAVSDDTPISFLDKNDVTHTLPYSTFKQVMMGYGAAYSAIYFARYQ